MKASLCTVLALSLAGAALAASPKASPPPSPVNYAVHTSSIPVELSRNLTLLSQQSALQSAQAEILKGAAAAAGAIDNPAATATQVQTIIANATAQINDIIPKLDSASAQKVQEIESQLQMLEGQVISVTNSVLGIVPAPAPAPVPAMAPTAMAVTPLVKPTIAAAAPAAAAVAAQSSAVVAKPLAMLIGAAVAAAALF